MPRLVKAVVALLCAVVLGGFCRSSFAIVVPACGNGGPVYLTNFSSSASTGNGMTVQFNIAGGSSNTVYYILTTTNLSAGLASGSNWTWLGNGHACDTCIFTHQPADGAYYALAVATGGPVMLTNLLCITSTSGGVTVKLDVTGGANHLLYDILTTTNFADGGINANWSWAAQGFAQKTYTFTGPTSAQAFYAVGPAPVTFVAAWGDNSHGQCNVPPGLTNAVQVAGGMNFSAALRGDGSILAWGDNTRGETTVPAGLAQVTSIATGPYHTLALKADGTVACWGSWISGAIFAAPNIPPGLTNIIAIAAGADHDMALKSDGSILVWGYTNDVYNTTPTNLPPATAIAASWNQNAALLAGGAVKLWTSNLIAASTPTNTVTLSAWASNMLALRADGTVAAWGDNTHGQTNVPPGLSNVVAVAGGLGHGLALGRDGTVAVWGDFGAAGPVWLPEGLGGVTAIGPGANHGLAIGTRRSTPVVVQQPATQTQMLSGTATFSVTNLTLGTTSYQWRLNGTNISGATNAILTLTNLGSNAQGSYTLLISNAAGSILTSNAALNLIPRPPPKINAWTHPTHPWVNSKSNFVMSLSVNDPPGTTPSVCSWQFNGTNLVSDQTNSYAYQIFNLGAAQQGTYVAMVTNQAGTNSFSWQVQAAFPGSVALWGRDDYGQSDRPAGLTSNVIGIAAGQSSSFAVMANGSVAQWGQLWSGTPPTLTNAVAVSVGLSHALALKNDGTVTSWGDSNDSANWVPTNLSGVKAVAAGWNHNVALFTNGVITAWGVDGANLGWHLTEIPPGLSNVTAVAAGSLHSLALRSDGSVVGWGYSPNGETNVPPGLANVVAISAGEQHNLALKADGTVVAWGYNGSGQCNVPAGLSNVLAISAGRSHSVALKNDGTVVAWGDDSQGQTDVSTNLANVKFIAAGGYHSVAAIFSPQLPYPVEASHDLLLVYNTSSTDSAAVLNYYLQTRPYVGNANVLGINCTNAEIIQAVDFTNLIVAPLRNWLAANPTKRPGYVVLFLDVPSRVTDPTASPAAQPSVSYQIATGIPGWQPFVTHINMGDVNACRAYIDKVTRISSGLRPGGLVVSASRTGYGNSRFNIDNIRNGNGHPDNYAFCWWLGAGASNGLTENGVRTNSLWYATGLETITNGIYFNLPHLTAATNLAGYFSWGSHSSLGTTYATDGTDVWLGNSSWYIMQTVESFNGQRYVTDQGNFIQWFSANAFGGVNYLNTPVGAVTHVEEPGLSGINDPGIYFGLWAAGRNFAICAWNSRMTPYFQAVGDPFVSY